MLSPIIVILVTTPCMTILPQRWTVSLQSSFPRSTGVKDYSNSDKKEGSNKSNIETFSTLAKAYSSISVTVR